MTYSGSTCLSIYDARDLPVDGEVFCFTLLAKGKP
jgi:hypothetical protein